MTTKAGNGELPGRRRERSTRYPGVSLAQSIEFTRQIADKGVDGLPAAAIAAAMGYKNIRTHALATGLSSSRQFGLIILRDNGYALTDLARSILSSHRPQTARRAAFLEPPLYGELCARFGGKRVPDAAALANWLQHNHGITPSAKLAAAEVFLASARDAGMLDDDGVLRVEDEPPDPPASAPDAFEKPQEAESDVDFTLRLWGDDEGKAIRVCGPARITRESLDRLLQALRLHVRIDGGEQE